jgi:hypothetical protein
VISTAEPFGGVGVVDAELALADDGSTVGVADVVGDDAVALEVAVAEPVTPDVGTG